MRRYRLVILCSLGAVLGFGACSLDPVPVLPANERGNNGSEPPAAGPGTPGSPIVGIDLDGDGVIDGYDTDGDGVIDSSDTDGDGMVNTPGDPETPGSGQPTDGGEFEGVGGEGGAAGDTSI